MISKAKIKLIRSLEIKKYRQTEGLFVAEGHKVIEELCKICEPVDIYEGDDAAKASFLQHPQGILALFPINIFEKIIPQSKLKLMLDGIQDPGNLGTIIRIADWFGIDHMYCSLNTVDVLNPKTVQASMGSIARVRIEYCDLEQLLDSISNDIPIYGTLLNGDNIYDSKLTEEGIIVMGNEGNGISNEIRKRITKSLLIPSYPAGRPTAESLNVAIATAIVCSEFRKL